MVKRSRYVSKGEWLASSCSPVASEFFFGFQLFFLVHFDNREPDEYDFFIHACVPMAFCVMQTHCFHTVSGTENIFHLDKTSVRNRAQVLIFMLEPGELTDFFNSNKSELFADLDW